MRLLLVEDHLSFATYMKKELAKEGFPVDCVGTISDGEVAVKAVNYDVIILDRGLPDDNGPEYVSELLATWAEKRGIGLQFIQPSKPQQNAYVERYNRTVRYDWLNQYIFEQSRRCKK